MRRIGARSQHLRRANFVVQRVAMLERVRTSATACSATAFGEYSGTRTTGNPSAAAAARSTWL